MTLARAARQVSELLTAAGRQRDAGRATILADRFGRRGIDVSVVGQTSAGKSTLINAALREATLPVGVRPTTASIVRVECTDGGSPTYVGLTQASDRISLDRDEFLRQCVTPEPSFTRIELVAPGRFPGLGLFDTPGYDSMELRHTATLRAVVPESEAVVLVVNYRVGVGQSEQDLFEDVGAALSQNPDMALLLVINRCPPGTNASDRQVAAIALNVADCLRRQPDVLLVESVTTSPGTSPPVNADVVWQNAEAASRAPDRVAAVAKRRRAALDSLIADGIAWCDATVCVATTDEDQLALLLETIADLEDARERSLDLVRATDKRMVREIAHLLERMVQSETKVLCAEVEASNKWLGPTECVQWIDAHALLQAVRRIACQVEEQIVADLTRLDAELDEIANTTRARLLRRAELRSASAQDLAFKLSTIIGRRLAEGAIRSGLGAFGGVGGVAAGAGNLVKTLLSRAGHLFDKTFSRAVYDGIGRAFNKQMVARLAVALTILVELGLYGWDVKTWRGKVQKRVEEALAAWQESATTGVREQLATLAATNMRDVAAMFDELLDEHRELLATLRQSGRDRRSEVLSIRDQLVALRAVVAEGAEG